MARLCDEAVLATKYDPSRGFFDVPPVGYDAVSGTYTDSRGCEFRQLYQELPALAPLYLEAEKRFNALPFVFLAERSFGVAVCVCAAYLALCFTGTRLMAGRKPFALAGALAAWNLLLAVFSTVGFLRTAPHLLVFLRRDGFYASVCTSAEVSYGQGAAGLWTMLFIYSKVPELIDTAFVVLRKKPLIFLHWYHHVTVLLYCWHSYYTLSSAGLWFVAMNYGVHAVMYFYYFLTALRLRPAWAPLVTALQIGQMFVGVGICVAVYAFQARGRPCHVTRSNFAAGVTMYGSYLLLFLQFAAERYLSRCWGRGGRGRRASGVDVGPGARAPGAANGQWHAVDGPREGGTDAAPGDDVAGAALRRRAR